MPVERAADRRALLAKQELFRKLGERQLDELLGVSHLQKLGAREELFHKGDEGTQLYVILSGRLKAMTTSPQGDDVTFSIMGPGQVVGELALLLPRGRRTATVVALDPCELLVLQRRDFLPFLRRHPDAAVRLMETLAEMVLRLSETFEDTHFLNLPVRLAKRLLELGQRYGVEQDGKLRIDLRLSQTELGDLVATSRESINKLMKEWRAEGIAAMEDGYVSVLDAERLEDIALGE